MAIRVVSLMDMKKNEDLVAQLIRRLVKEDFHTSKGAACAIIPGVFNGILHEKTSLNLL